MTEPLLWLAALGPLALIAVALPMNRRPAVVANAATVASMLTLVIMIATACWRIGSAGGALRTGTMGVDGVGLAFYVDALTAIVAMLVAFVGTIVIRYSRNYMDGDAGHVRFVRLLSLTLAFVLLLILSGNLFQLALAWTATALSLDQLLLFYRERPAAALAARKKFIVSRMGDACLIAAMLLVHRLFGSLDYDAIFLGARALQDTHDVPASVHAIAVLLVIAGVLKSAQFPLHGWLIEVMETPTPVSALLHAGIINAGGFLLLRFANVLALSWPALDLLLVVGGLTALFGSVVMMTQTSVKVSLAYSTIAQMGFMMLQIGLGAFSAALLHLVAHSLYKAHAFLSSGSVIDLARASWSPSPGGRPHPARVAFAIAIVLAAALGVGTLFGATLTRQPGVFALGAIVLLGLTHLLGNAIDERPNLFVVGRTVLLAGVVAAAYFMLQWVAARLTAHALPPVLALRGPFDLAIIAGVVLGFAAITVFQNRLSGHAAASRWQAWYAHVSNGFYVNTLANRWVLRWWPPASVQQPAVAHPSRGA